MAPNSDERPVDDPDSVPQPHVPTGPQAQGGGRMQWSIRRSTRPSLDTLQHDQREALYSGDDSRSPPLTPLVDRFRSRRDLINWYQACNVRTFGHLTERWPPHDLVRDKELVDALCARDEHEASKNQLWLHARTIEAVVLPACGTAYRHLRDKSGERTANANDRYSEADDDWSDIEPAEEHHIGMRPAYSLLDREQADALGDLWGGFDSRRNVSEWLHSLHAATYGTYGASEAGELLSDQYATEMFLADSLEAQLFRERFASIELLPAFATAASQLQAGEQHDTESDDTWRSG